jgi:hypothetical protein
MNVMYSIVAMYKPTVFLLFKVMRHTPIFYYLGGAFSVSVIALSAADTLIICRLRIIIVVIAN